MSGNDQTHRFASKPWFKNPKKGSTQIPCTSAKLSQTDTKLHTYVGFNLYFSNNDKLDIIKTIQNVSTCEKFIQRNSERFSLSDIRNHRVFFIDLKHVLSDEVFDSEWPEFKTDIITQTDYCLKCLGLAMHQSVVHVYDSPVKKDVPFINTRILNHQPVLNIKSLKVNYLGNLVSFRGTVIKANTIISRLSYKYILFTCSSCSGRQDVNQVDGIFTLPTKCLTKGCKAQSKFRPTLNKSNRVDWHTITLQEVGGVDAENRHVPRTIECELTNDLVGCCSPGDDVTMTGIIKVQNTGDGRNKKNHPSMFLLYLDAISVVNNKNQGEATNSSLERITFSTRDYYAIQKIHAEPSLFRFLVHSLCPNIYGNEIVKAGLLLALFGGTQNLKGDIVTRCASHVLMVGDPGLGKSQILQACTNVAPRGVYVCGNTSTTAGLTVTITKESCGDFSLEAGALLLANQGNCCIDEFDKMTNQHSCLLEAMEQQSVSIAKAGVTCTLPASASILAAANPADGHYNKAKTVSENLKLSAPLISRFDLVFLLLDQPCEKYDVLISEHVLALHLGVEKQTSLDMSVLSNTSLHDNLSNRLKLQSGESIDYLPHILFRKYIAYSQKYVHPKATPEAKELLKTFYLKLRKNCSLSNCTVITARQLESLLRLTQARAKLELREEATAADALDVIEIMKHSFIDAFSDEHGVLDFQRSQHGSGISKQSMVKKVLAALQSKAENLKKATFELVELKQLVEEVGIPKQNFYDIIDKLNFHGYILKKSSRCYQLTTVDYQ